MRIYINGHISQGKRRRNEQAQNFIYWYYELYIFTNNAFDKFMQINPEKFSGK